uniref:Transposase (Putative), gypsy type n=1 Tax=Tanacetum cinerariifolium TaxID=118510 RepID=A0A6L2M7R2_TANCI|nr:hypothetical protein [Tanacetum cinerariifolium]
MNVSLFMFGALLLHRVCKHVYGTDIITVDQCCCKKRSMKLTKKVVNPRCISYSIRNPTVFSLGTRRRQCVLRLEDHVKRLSPRKTQYPEVDRLFPVRISQGIEWRLRDRRGGDGGGGGGVVCGDDGGGGGVGVLYGDGVDDGVRGVFFVRLFVVWDVIIDGGGGEDIKFALVGKSGAPELILILKKGFTMGIRMSSGAPDFPTRANLSNTGEDQPHAYLNSDDHERRPQSISSVAQGRIVISDVTGDRGYAIADGLSVNQAPGFDGVGAPRNLSLIDDSGANTSENTAAALTLSQIRPAVYSQDTDQASDMDNRLNYAGKSVNGRRQKNVTVKSLHPELPGLEDPIVEFPEGKIDSSLTIVSDGRGQRWMSFSKRLRKNTPQCYTKPFDSLKNWNNRFFWVHEKVQLLTATASCVIDIRDTAVASGSSRTLAAIKKSPLDFADEDPPQVSTERMVKRPRRYSRKTSVVEDPNSEKSTSFTSMVGSPGIPPGYFSKLRHLLNFLSQYNVNLARQVAKGPQLRLRFEQEAKLLRKAVAQVARRDQRIKAKGKHIRNLKALLEAEADMKGAAKARNVELAKELESLRVQFSDLQVSNNQLSQQVFTLHAQITSAERIKAAFEEFKKYEDDWELYPHMLTAIAGRRWVIGHSLRLAVMKSAESTKLRQVFADVVSAGIAKGISEGLKHDVEHRKAKVDLAAIEAYDPEADTKYFVTLHALKDLKYPLVDELEKLKDTPIDVIMASLFLESDFREDAPQWIHELRPSYSQLKISVYLEVRNPKDPWSFKDDILLEDAIAANVCRAEKKKKCRVVCRTYGVSSARHTIVMASPYQYLPLLLKVLPSC